MSAKNLHSAYAVKRRKSNEQDSFVENLSDDDGEKVCACKIQQKLASTIYVLYTQARIIILYNLFRHYMSTKLRIEILFA